MERLIRDTSFNICYANRVFRLNNTQIYISTILRKVVQNIAATEVFYHMS